MTRGVDGQHLTRLDARQEGRLHAGAGERAGLTGGVTRDEEVRSGDRDDRVTHRGPGTLGRLGEAARISRDAVVRGNPVDQALEELVEVDGRGVPGGRGDLDADV
ncbi:MAG: hypothetical protein VW964_09105, partial [Ilumatobacter sp.]